MDLLRARRLIAAALLLGGCGGRAAAPSSSAQPRGPSEARPPLNAAEIREIVTHVSAARQLPEKRRVRVDQIDARQFIARLREGTAAPPSPDGLGRGAAFLLAYNLVPPPEASKRTSSVQEVLEEQIVGFYDNDEDRVFVRETAIHSKADELKTRGVLAHEIHHALQAQNFHVPTLEKLSGDERLAASALIEGDAMVAMGAYLGAEYGAPIRRTLRTITDVTKTVAVDDVAHPDKDSERLARALPLTRERLLFPYFAGMRFVSDIYRAGGFPLVDKLYERVPSSTSQILHPEKYLLGEEPIPVRAPSAPAGFQPMYAERLGEFQTGVVLSQCVSKERATQAAAGWRGDFFSIVTSADRRLALLWSTVWDSPEDATEFESALRDKGECWRASALGNDAAAYHVDGHFIVQRDANRVAFARGLPEAALPAVARDLLRLPERPKPNQPVGDYRIPERVPLPEPQRGSVVGDIFRSDWLGVTARVPSGMRTNTRDGELQLMIERDDVLVTGALVLSERIASQRFNELAFHEIADSFAKRLRGFRVLPISGGELTLPIGRAIERTWAVEGTAVQLRTILVPVCAGMGSYVFIQAYADPYARTVLDGWLYSFRWMANPNAPACDRLDPK